MSTRFSIFFFLFRFSLRVRNIDRISFDKEATFDLVMLFVDISHMFGYFGLRNAYSTTLEIYFYVEKVAICYLSSKISVGVCS